MIILKLTYVWVITIDSSSGRLFKFIAGSLYTNTITDDNIETVKEDIKNILDEFKKQETPDYLINHFPFLNDYDW